MKGAAPPEITPNPVNITLRAQRKPFKPRMSNILEYRVDMKFEKIYKKNAKKTMLS